MRRHRQITSNYVCSVDSSHSLTPRFKMRRILQNRQQSIPALLRNRGRTKDGRLPFVTDHLIRIRNRIGPKIGPNIRNRQQNENRNQRANQTSAFHPLKTFSAPARPAQIPAETAAPPCPAASDRHRAKCLWAASAYTDTSLAVSPPPQCAPAGR